MTEKINFYTSGRDLAIKKKFPSKKLFTLSKPNKELDYKALYSDINDMYSYLVEEYERNPEVVPLSASWILDNYYLINQQFVIFKDTFKSKIFKKLPVAEYDNLYFQIHYISKKYLEYTSCDFSQETLIPFLKGYQKIYPLSSLELWILPTIIKFELLKSLLSRGLEVEEKIENSKYANQIVSEISSDLAKGKKPLKRVKKVLNQENVNPHILLSILEDIRELDYRVESTLELIEGKIHEADLNLEEFTRASVLRDLDLKQSLNNTVTSIKNFSYINWDKLFNKVSIVEGTLLNDPANVYGSMDDISRDRYRHVIEDMSTNSNFSESEIARKVIETSSASNIDIQRHVGFHLIDQGYRDFSRKIGFKPSLKGIIRDFIKKFPEVSYFGSLIIFTLAISAVSLSVFNIISKDIGFILISLLLQIIPASNISLLLITKLSTYYLSPSLPPKIELKNGIPNDHKTMVVVPCLFSSKEKVDVLIDNLEKRFLSNKYNNLYFALLSDYKDSDTEETEDDSKNLRYLKTKIKKLNIKHRAAGFEVFYLFHRKRLFNDKENAWMGWERKRGKLMQFVDWLSDGAGSISPHFTVIDGKIEDLKEIKYVITLDEDTMLPADSSLKLIGAMMHPLNTPVIDYEKKIVIRGYGLIQPRIVIDPEAENISPFTKVFVADSGYDSYSTAVSDTYQDLFNRSNFMGKGIFNVVAVKASLGERFPENKLLSHDLIESCFARSGFLSDTSLIEDFPSTFNSYVSRDNRWVRGDWQLLPWLLPVIPYGDGKKRKNPLDTLSYWMVFDNLRRSLVLPSFLLLFIFAWFSTTSNYFTSFIMLLFFFNIFIDITNTKKYFIHRMPFHEKIKLSLIFIGKRTVLLLSSFIFLSLFAYHKIRSIIITLNRIVVDKKLLEWTTHSESEHQEKNNRGVINPINIKFILINLSAIFLLYLLDKLLIINTIILTLWTMSPIIVCYLSRPFHKIKISDQIEDKERMYFYAKKIWSYFEKYTNEVSNYLPPDNLQLSPVKKVTYRTSPTNIGFYLLTLLSAYDLKIIDVNQFVDRLENTINVIYKLPKYKGHLYNWYDIKTLTSLNPYISTADSGNFVISMMLMESSCVSISENIKRKHPDHAKKLQQLSHLIRSMYVKTDFTFLYHKDLSIFSIGFNSATREKDKSYYDLLASEARIASYVAIALDQIEVKHWFKLGRPLQIRNGKYYLMSWGGTMFEYLLPTLLLDEKDNTILSQTNREIFEIQKEYAEENNIPWGISESNFDAFDFDSNYQYKMMGVTDLALKRYDTRDLVVSPYSSFLSLMINPKDAEENLKLLEELKVFGPHGFFESIDFNRSSKESNEGESVRIYTAHHQGMSMVAINNVLNEKIMVRRLKSNDFIKSCEVLLDEKIPEVSNVVEPNQYTLDRKLTSIRRFEKERVRYSDTPNTLFPLAQIYGNGRYSVMMTNSGAGYSKFKDTYINRFYEDFTLDSSGNHIYIRDLGTNEFWSSTYQPTIVQPDKYEVKYYAEYAEISRTDNKTDTKLNVFVPPEKNFEIREFSITNNSGANKTYEITTYMEVMLDDYKSGITHPAFNKLFLETSYEDGMLVAERKKRYLRDIDKFAFHFAFSEDGSFKLDSYETSRPNFIGRVNSIQNPNAMHSPLTKSVGNVLDPIFSLRHKVELSSGETKNIYFVYGYANNMHEIRATKDLLFSREEINELRYLNRHFIDARRTHIGIDVKQEIIYQKVASRLIYSDHRLKEQSEIEHARSRNLLYRFGISGDNKMLVLKVNSKNNELVKDMVLLHEYFRLLKFDFDLIYLVDENISYEETLEREVYEAVDNSLSNQYKDMGVYILNVNNMTLEERFTLLSLAKAVFDTSLGSLDDQINLASRSSGSESIIVKEPLYQESVESISLVKDPREDLDYYNGIGGFTPEGKSYIMNIFPDNATPLPWSNVISNEMFGTLLTESGLGYTWNINSQMNKLTPWSNDYVSDPQGEVLYIKDVESGEIYSSTPLPNKRCNFRVKHSQGYSEYIGTDVDIEHKLKVFVDNEDPVKIIKLTLRNTSRKTKKLECSYYVEFVLGEHRCTNQEDLDVKFEPNRRYITARNVFDNNFSNEIAFISTSMPVIAATADRKKYFGRGNSRKMPLWIMEDKKGITGFKSISDKCGVLTNEVEIPAGSQVSLSFVLGQSNDVNHIDELVDKYSIIKNVDKSYENVKKKWADIQSFIRIDTPDNKINYLINNWLIYQVISCRLHGRTSFYQAAGAYGFRDQLQDVMALIYSDPNKVRDHIILCCKHQFKEGDVQHWWHYPSNVGVRTKISDDLLWLPYVVSYYIEKTGDYEILREVTPYLEMRNLESHEESIFEIPNVSQESGDVLDHCIRAINKSINFGSHGLPLIGTGDWNDSLSSVGDEGKGESVWLGWFLISVINNFIKILINTDRRGDVSRYKSIVEDLKRNIDVNAWDGEWYMRGFYDDGTPLGSHINNECIIDSISQSWGVISEAALPEKITQSMKSHDENLVDREYKIIKLLTPPFKDSTPFPGYIQGYPEGIRENGGQYTHGAIWSVKAHAIMGDGDKAYELLNMLNPINRSYDEKKLQEYKSEPFVMVGDIYSNSQHMARGGWSWFTGSAGWFYQVVVEDILGLKKFSDYFTLKPVIPSDWEGYNMTYKYQETVYKIIVVRGKEKGLFVDSKKINDNKVSLEENGGEVKVELVI